MTTIALPAALIDPRTFSFELQTNQRVFASPYTGSEQVSDMLNDRWLAHFSIPPRTINDGAEIEAFIASLRGYINTIDLFHLVRPVPRGTMRGSPTAEPAPAGVPGVTIQTVVGATLLPGDMLKVNGMLLQVASACVADINGRMYAPTVNRLRNETPNGSPVTWDRPTVPFRMLSNSGVNYVPGYTEIVSFDFGEVIV